uniref:Uncharacterized protein n=1 Tax=Rhizophora mucronata TaxID=61149 RepID=A0A2P2Q1A4_RHIMU
MVSGLRTRLVTLSTITLKVLYHQRLAKKQKKVL